MHSFILSSQLKELLHRNECSLSDLAKDTEIAPSTLHGWLNGLEPKSVIKLKRVADYFGVTVDNLCFGDTQPEEVIEFRGAVDLKNTLKEGLYEVKFIKQFK